MPLSNGELETLLCSPVRLRTLTDTQLMDALQSGCNDALAVLFERHSATVFGATYRKLRDHGDATVAVRRIFGDIFRARNEFNPERESFEHWLLGHVERGRERSLA
jgi:DNA-directed RNA polymerase specialized sigma24 family protein